MAFENFARTFADNPLMKSFAQNNPMQTAFAPVDIRQIMDMWQKNAQSVAEAQRVAMEGVQELARRQTEMLSQMTQEHTQLVGEIMKSGTPQEKLAKQTEIMRKAGQAAMGNMRDITGIMRKTAADISEILRHRMQSAMNEMTETIETQAAGAKKKK